MTVQIRGFTTKDLPVLVRLLNKTYRDSYEFTQYTEDKLSSWIEEGKLKILMARENDEITGSIAYRDGHWGEEIEWLTVPENANRKIIEDELVKETEKYVKGQTVFTVVDEGSSKINEWTERGYTPEGGLYHMVSRLDRLEPLPKVPESTIIRSLRLEEEKEFVETVNTAFGAERLKLGTIQKWKSELPTFSEEWIHIAELDNKIVAAVVAKPDTNHNKFHRGRRGYLGPAATLPECRGKNLASALTRQAMNFLLKKGMDSAALYTSEQNIPSVKLLRKLGFEVAHHWKFMRKNLSQKGQAKIVK